MDLSTGEELGWGEGGGLEQERGRGSAPGESLINTLKHDIIGREIRRSASNQQQPDAVNHYGNVSHVIPSPPLFVLVQSGGTGQGTFRPSSVFVSYDTFFSRSTMTLECYSNH